jgi:hypothetical protein
MVVRALEYLPVVDVTFGDVVRSLVTADRVLYPDDELKLRRTLVEALRRRGIVPQGVLSLADAELSWPRPTDLSLTGPAAPVDLRPLILSATLDLDPVGPAGPMPEDRSAASAPDEDDLHDDERAFSAAAVGWARAHAREIGLDPSVPIELEGRHAAYRQAADRQPRPEVVLQFTQRRRDLEDQDLPEDRRPVFRAGTTLIAGVDGPVDFVVAKPFPFVDEAALAELPRGHPAHRHQQEGAVRLTALRTWLDQVRDDDALSAWTLEPPIDRLDLARMHSGIPPEVR